MAKPPAKKRPYDAMRDESSRAIDAMPYTEKSKPKAAPKPAPKAKGRPYDPVKDEPTSRPFKKGGSVKMAAGGSFSEAFRAARKAGKSDFSWNDKKYTTEMKGEAKRPPKAAAPAPAPTKKPPTFGETVARAAGFRGEKKPEAPSFGASNRAAYKDMMAKSAEARGEETKRRAAETVARNKAEDARREAQRQRDNTRTGPIIDLNPFPSKEESAAARAKATSVRNAVSGRPGQAKAKGGKIKAKKRYV